MAKQQHNLRSNEKMVIIPDTCSLVYAMYKIPEQFFINDPAHPNYVSPDKRPKTMLDMLTDYLPRDKIKGIHILDIVGGEAFGRDGSGKIYNSALKSSSKRKRPDLPTKWIDGVYQDTDNFTKIIRTPRGEKLVNIYKTIHTLYDQTDDYFAAHIHPDEVKERTQDAKQVMRRFKRKIGKDMGEIIADEYIRNNHRPILFISEDTLARERIIDASKQEHNACVYAYNNAGFLNTLKEAGVFKSCGLHEWVNGQTIMIGICKEIKRHDMLSSIETSHTSANGKRDLKPKTLEAWMGGPAKNR